MASLNLSFPVGKIPSEFSRKIRQHYYAATTYIDDLVGQVLEAAAKADHTSRYPNFVLLSPSDIITTFQRSVKSQQNVSIVSSAAVQCSATWCL